MKYKFRKLLSAMCVCALITSVVPISGAAANQSGLENELNVEKYAFSHLTDKSGSDNLIFTYYGENQDGIKVQLIQDDVPVYTENLDANITGADFNDLQIGQVYKYVITIGESDTYSGTVELTESDVIVTGVPVSPVPNASGEVFQAKRSNGVNIGSSTTSLFRAIESARSAGQGSYVLMNSSTNVFTMTGSDETLYRYQFDQYYGTVNSDEAKEWMAGYDYVHIINGLGQFVYSSIKSLNGGLSTTDPPSVHPFERNSGAYYYNSTYPTSDKKLVFDVDLSQASLVRADASKNMPSNGYIYGAVQQTTGTFEFGLFLSATGTSTSVVPYYRLPKSNDIQNKDQIKLATGTRNSSTGKITWNNCGTIRITIALVSDGVYCKAENLKTGVAYETTLKDVSGISYNSNSTLICMCSLPHITDGYAAGALRDLRSGASFRNIKISNEKTYKTKESTSGSSFATGTSNCGYAYIYNTDCASYSSTGSGASKVENISIFYDRDER